MIRRAKIREIPKIMELTTACAQHMSDQGVYQWNEHYPSKEVFMNDIKRKELYTLAGESGIKGVIAITTTMDEEYKPVKWLTNNDQNIYIHRLAVHPDYQGLGFAQKLMTYAENMAKQKGYNSIRLDTFSKNTRNQKFYEQRGYIRLEDIYFPMQSKDPFHCYELVL